MIESNEMMSFLYRRRINKKIYGVNPSEKLPKMFPLSVSQKSVILVLLDSLRDVQVMSEQSGAKHKDLLQLTGKTGTEERLRDFCGECVELSSALERSPAKHNWFRATSE